MLTPLAISQSLSVMDRGGTAVLCGGICTEGPHGVPGNWGTGDCIGVLGSKIDMVSWVTGSDSSSAFFLALQFFIVCFTFL